MPGMMTRSFRLVLYSALAVFLAINVWALVAGNYFAVIPLCIELVVLVSVYLGKPWAFVAIRVWACVLIIAGVAMWLAVLLDGVAHFHSPARAVVLTIMLVLGLYLLVYSRSGSQQISSAI
ncbi:MAG TPA: hypothetical protein VJL61_06990 [Rhodanobacteraceae bacterium]|nr:hypothetical protein [Rhodanobacteraceae bacterium]